MFVWVVRLLSFRLEWSPHTRFCGFTVLMEFHRIYKAFRGEFQVLERWKWMALVVVHREVAVHDDDGPGLVVSSVFDRKRSSSVSESKRSGSQ